MKATTVRIYSLDQTHVRVPRFGSNLIADSSRCLRLLCCPREWLIRRPWTIAGANPTCRQRIAVVLVDLITTATASTDAPPATTPATAPTTAIESFTTAATAAISSAIAATAAAPAQRDAHAAKAAAAATAATVTTATGRVIVTVSGPFDCRALSAWGLARAARIYSSTGGEPNLCSGATQAFLVCGCSDYQTQAHFHSEIIVRITRTRFGPPRRT